ncbi:hypothetical protein, partial [Nocardioides sp.]|uniref:hypothetical protein n=1 Tax=Nocardioides sp. TaxID=35761 RepID=UPI0039E2BD5A
IRSRYIRTALAIVSSSYFLAAGTSRSSFRESLQTLRLAQGGSFTKTRYRGIGKNLNHLKVLFASANWLMRARAVALMG